MGNRRTATFYLAIVVVLVFVVNVAVGGGNRFWIFLTGGGHVKEYGEATLSLITEQGQWWRILTCGYLHMGVIHLVGNMAALEIVGTKIEKKIGPVKMLLIYNFGTMLTAFLWCLIFRNGTIIGASLGIFVLLGMACVWCRKGQEKHRVCFSLAEKSYLIIYTIVGCFLGIGTIAVHAIGFLIGMSVGGIYGKIIYSRAKSE